MQQLSQFLEIIKLEAPRPSTRCSHVQVGPSCRQGVPKLHLPSWSMGQSQPEGEQKGTSTSPRDTMAGRGRGRAAQSPAALTASQSEIILGTVEPKEAYTTKQVGKPYKFAALFWAACEPLKENE